ncbi:MAG: SCO family protein [Vulcanimicrobiaceae bacterium]
MKILVALVAALAPATQSAPVVAAGPQVQLFREMGAALPPALEDVVTNRPLLPELHGKAVLVSFIAGTCRETCPLTEAKFAAIQSDLARDGDLGRVRLVLVTVDPLADTPARLRALAHKLGARPGTFALATGSPQAVARVLRAYDIEVRFNGGSRIDPDHTVALYLIDPTWHVRYDFGPAYPSAAIARLTNRFVRFGR